MSLFTQMVHCSARPIATSWLVRSMRRPISLPAMITKHGCPVPLGRSDGIEIAVRRPGKIDVIAEPTIVLGGRAATRATFGQVAPRAGTREKKRRMATPELIGVFTALVTPFSADGSEIDWAAY